MGTMCACPFSHALYSAVLPLFVTAWTLLPYCSSRLATSPRPCSEAMMRPVRPLRMDMFGSAPRASSSARMSVWPWKADRCTAVSPPMSASLSSNSVARSRSQPPSTSMRTMAAWPLAAANMSLHVDKGGTRGE